MTDYTDITTQEDVIENLQTQEMTVTFTKLNGEERVMTCTLEPSKLPLMEGTSTRKQNPDAQSVWDVNAQGWRAFRWDSVTDISVSKDD